jgi:hypothetical protein
MLPAITQNVSDVIKLFHENQILDSSFLCRIARSKGIDKVAIIKIQK